jgi:hypothetical protein
MQCPECKSANLSKNGQRKGKQNHICLKGGRQFIDGYEPRLVIARVSNPNPYTINIRRYEFSGD